MLGRGVAWKGWAQDPRLETGAGQEGGLQGMGEDPPPGRLRARVPAAPSRDKGGPRKASRGPGLPSICLIVGEGEERALTRATDDQGSTSQKRRVHEWVVRWASSPS